MENMPQPLQERIENVSDFHVLEKTLEHGGSVVQHYVDVEGVVSGGEIFAQFDEHITSPEKEALFHALEQSSSEEGVRLSHKFFMQQLRMTRQYMDHDESSLDTIGINLMTQIVADEQAYEDFVGELQHFTLHQLERVRFEISEKSQLDEVMLSKIKYLVRHGVRFALDDMGVDHHALTAENVSYLSRVYNELGEGLSQVKFDPVLWQRDMWDDLWTKTDKLHPLVEGREVVYEWAEELSKQERSRLAQILYDAGAVAVKFQGGEKSVIV